MEDLLISRRSFLKKSVATGALATACGAAEIVAQTRVVTPRSSSYVELLRRPDSVTAFIGIDDRFSLQRDGNNFAARDVIITLGQTATELRVGLTSPKTALTRLHLRWLGPVDTTLISLGDSWERSYGDLGWRCMAPDRVMPWYFATYDGTHVHAYGVKTGPAAMCFWQIDPEGISLWMDICNGGDGVLLGNRHLEVATIVTRHGEAQESPLAALRAFCKQMCPAPRLPKNPVYGVNDWYVAYGVNNEQMLLRMADLVAELAPSGDVRPFAAVDTGWKDGTQAWPNMAKFAARVKNMGVRPGIWLRVLEAEPLPNGPQVDVNAHLLLPTERFGQLTERGRERAFDPTIPEALDIVTQKLKTFSNWGYEMVKHDYSTYDLLGRWGFEMGPQPTFPGWHFNDRSRTNAEIIVDFYKALRTTLGDEITILAITTIPHLAAGYFELHRTGDDTSGKIFERTRRMGVNTLAFKLPQHGTFYRVDPDCVGITKAVPWELNRQWLDLVARSRTTLFVSPEDGQIHAEQRAALRDAYAMVASAGTSAEPADFFHDTTPELWKSEAGLKRYQWCGTEGSYPFTV
jgi:alpha-galactosidase